MQGFCPSCETETTLIHIVEHDTIQIRDESISVQVDYFRCKQCGNDFDNPALSNDPLASAYREYRKRKGLPDGDTLPPIEEPKE